MALSIKNEATERLAREVAEVTRESLTQAIQTALEERWKRLESARRSRVLAGQVEDILQRVDAMPALDSRPLDSRPEDEILGYDEHGAPRRW